MSPALDKASRQIILCFVDGMLAGYLQYYTREKMPMIEELQLKKEYHRTFVFFWFCKHLMHILPTDIEHIEAYAEKINLNSQRIMKKLGMEPVEADDSPSVHFRGAAQQVKGFFR